MAAIVGPTAAGKSGVAEAAAKRFHATIISIDSMQVYRGMDIGTAKPDRAVRNWVDYRMVDVCDPADDLTVQAFQREARRHIEELAIQYRRVIIAGGSGLHFRAVVDPMTFEPTDPEVRASLEGETHADVQRELITLDPDAAKHVDLANFRRVVRAVEVARLTGRTPKQRASTFEAGQIRRYEAMYPFAAIGMDPGDASHMRVRSRLDSMVEAGLPDEVSGLAGKLGTAASQAVGYKEFAGVATGEVTVGAAFADTLRSTNSLVKRQRTFFRRDPRIEWQVWQDDAEQRTQAAVERIGERMQWTS